MPIAEGVQIIFNGIIYVTLVIAIIGFCAGLLSALIKHNEKFKEKRKKEFEEFMQRVIKKSNHFLFDENQKKSRRNK